MPTSLIKRMKSDNLARSNDRYLDPFGVMHDFDSIFGDFRRQFDDLLWNPTQLTIMPWTLPRGSRMPTIDFVDKGENFLLSAELPGIKKEDLNVSISDNRIEIKAEHKEEQKEEKDNSLYRERSFISFHRGFEFPEEINSESAEAKLEDGILTLILPKKEVPELKQPRKMEIQ